MLWFNLKSRCLAVVQHSQRDQLCNPDVAEILFCVQKSVPSSRMLPTVEVRIIFFLLAAWHNCIRFLLVWGTSGIPALFLSLQ